MDRDKSGLYMKGHQLGGRPRTYTDERLVELAQSLRAWVEDARKKNKFILLSDWCFREGFNPTAFNIHTARSAEFKEAYQWAKAWQEHVIASGALQKNLDARFSQFFLAVNHGWTLDRDKENKENIQKSNLEKLANQVDNDVKLMEEQSEENE